MLEQLTTFSEKPKRKTYISPKLSEFGTIVNITQNTPFGGDDLLGGGSRAA